MTAAHLVCTKLDGGETPIQIAHEVLSDTHLDGFHAGCFVGAGVGAYCPNQAPLIG
nr:DUF732 domain-containing protein [Mycobacterium avium]